MGADTEPPPARTRRARPEDAGPIARVHVDSWRAAYHGLLPPAVLEGLSVARRTRHWDRVLAAGSDEVVVVAERDGLLVGFAHVSAAQEADTTPDTGQLVTIYLRPEAWGRDIGRQVHDAALGELAGLGYRSAVLWMLSTNTRAARFYERQGWQRDGRLRVQQFGGAVVIDHRLARPLPGTQILSRPSQ